MMSINLQKTFIGVFALGLLLSAVPVFADHGDVEKVETHATTIHTKTETRPAAVVGASTKDKEKMITLLKEIITLVKAKHALHTSADHHAMEDAGHDHAESVLLHATADLSVRKGMMGNFDINLVTTGFTFSPENADKAHVDGEGHVHVMVDGVKAGRMYSPWMYLPALSKGTHVISVALATNDHKSYVHDGKPIEDSVTVVVK